MYVKIKNNQIVYPYWIERLIQENPNTSFPKDFSEQILAEWGVYPVLEAPPPGYNPANQKAVEVAPELIDGKWAQVWAVVELSPEEEAQANFVKAGEVRAERNYKLNMCDWTQVPDAPVNAADWAAYRQSLRDVTAQPGFPWEVVWPTPPA